MLVASTIDESELQSLIDAFVIFFHSLKGPLSFCRCPALEAGWP